ncbi:hypothetical protein V1264_002363 [Littorina saxatilis]|uniref:Uncharacterized protein n=1 Tax=Littorina saxatilis TaxID=31220 RepID=A0AAN9GQ55_9CAEN
MWTLGLCFCLESLREENVYLVRCVFDAVVTCLSRPEIFPECEDSFAGCRSVRRGFSRRGLVRSGFS